MTSFQLERRLPTPLVMEGGERSNMISKCPNLFCVKSIVTILLTLAFVVLTFIHPDEYYDTMKTVFVTVITFYFSHQLGKTTEGSKNDDKRETRL